MTRALQQNLDLTKECRQDIDRGDVHTNLLPKCTREVFVSKGISGTNIFHDTSFGKGERSQSTICAPHWMSGSMLELETYWVRSGILDPYS